MKRIIPFVILCVVAFTAWALPAPPPDSLGIIEIDSTAIITLNFYNELNEAIAPSNLTYKLYDTNTGTVLIDPVSVANPGASYSFDIAYTLNGGTSKVGELKRTMELAWAWGNGRRSTKSVTYAVRVHRFAVPPDPTPTP